MTVTLRVFNNANELAQVTIPDAAIPEIQDALGGATNAETALNFLQEIKRVMRPHIEQMIIRQEDVAADTTKAATITNRKTTFTAAWPSEG
jgi:hypothetical protein